MSERLVNGFGESVSLKVSKLRVRVFYLLS